MYRLTYEITLLKQNELFKDQESATLRKENEQLKQTVDKLLDPKGKKKKK